MARSSTSYKLKEIDQDRLLELAHEYCDYCINSKKEVATPRGPVEVKERHLPTINYFMMHWLRKKDFDFYSRWNWWEILKRPDHPCHESVKHIDEMFRALATDVVANEGKGIFYAKNYLGMTDRIATENNHNISEIKITYE